MGIKALAAATVACAAAFVSVGFSAWYVAGSAQYTYSGNVGIEQVVGSDVSVSIESGEENQSVIYAAPEGAENSGQWLYSDGEDGTENLTLTYHFTFENVRSGVGLAISVRADDTKSGVEYSSQFGTETYDGEEASYAAAVGKGLIADAVDADISASQLSGLSFQSNTAGGKLFSFENTPDGTATATVTITFEWGEEFGGVNPYDKYKDLTDEEEQKEAADTLAYLAACLEGVTYTIVLVPETL